MPTPRLTSPELRKPSPISRTTQSRSPLLSKKPAPSTTRPLVSSSSLPSYHHNGIIYTLNQQVQCNLQNGLFEGTIKYIGMPLADKKDVYFGVVFTKNTGSQFSGVINVSFSFSIIIHRMFVCLTVNQVMVLSFFLPMLS